MSRDQIISASSEGRKDAKDIQLHAAPWEALAELGRVFHFGATATRPDGSPPYGDYNFRQGYDWSLSFDAMNRHLWLFWSGEDRDKESKLHHMAHAAWHALILTFFALTGRGIDDRPYDAQEEGLMEAINASFR